MNTPKYNLPLEEEHKILMQASRTSHYFDREGYLSGLKKLRAMGKMGRDLAIKVVTKAVSREYRYVLDKRVQQEENRNLRNFVESHKANIPGGFPMKFETFLDWFLEEDEKEERAMLLHRYHLEVKTRKEREEIINEIAEKFLNCGFKMSRLIADPENENQLKLRIR